MHMLVEAENKTGLAAMVRTLKAVSAKEILRTPHFRVGNLKHFWARRYGYREIEDREVQGIRKYIRNQKDSALPRDESKTPRFRVGNVKIPQAEACGHLTPKRPVVYIRTFG